MTEAQKKWAAELHRVQLLQGSRAQAYVRFNECGFQDKK